MKLYVTEERCKELLATIDDILESGVLERASASKLRGRLEHGATPFWGRFGRAFLRPLSERLYAGGVALTDAVARSLRFWRWLLLRGGRPRSRMNNDGQLADVIAFADGYVPDPRRKGEDPQPRVGWLVLERSTGWAFCGIWDVLQSLIDKWLPRKTQIVLVEAFAAVLVVEGFREMLRDRKLLLFIDSDPVHAALVKGYSSKEGLFSLVGFFWFICADASIAAYLDRVPSDANPSDCPSRGIFDDLLRAGAV